MMYDLPDRHNRYGRDRCGAVASEVGMRRIMWVVRDRFRHGRHLWSGGKREC